MKAYQIFFPLFLALFAAGCIDEPMQNGPNTISGKIVDANGFPCADFNVYINYFSKTVSDANGNFSISDVNLPFVLTFYKDIDENVYMFWGITKQQTVITLQLVWQEVTQNGFYVTYPPLAENRLALVNFISNDPYLPHSYRINDSTTFISLYQTSGSSITGKVIYLERNTEPEFWSYDKFGIKDFVLKNNESDTITFSGEEISFNPVDIELISNIFIPGGMSPGGTQTHLTLYSNQNSFISLNYYDLPVKIPVLPINFKVKFLSRAHVDYEIVSDSWVFINPGENAVITHNVPPRLMLPLNVSIGIRDTSLFSIYDDYPYGIYEYSFWGPGNVQAVLYTDRKSFRVSEIPANFLLLKGNTTYRWRVRKFTGYSSMDDFVSKSFIMDDKCKSIETSASYVFTTAEKMYLKK